MNFTIFKKIPLFLAITGVYGALILGCGTAKKKTPEASFPGPRSGAIMKAARANGIDERAMLSAAYVESNFGTHLNFSETGGDRSNFFSMQNNEVNQNKDKTLDAQADILAKKVKTLAGPSQDKFDVLTATAKAIVGDRADPNVKATSIALVLSELVRTYNYGFSVMLPEKEMLFIPPQPTSQQIDINSLTPTRRQMLNILCRRRSDTDAPFCAGNKNAAIERAENVPAKVVLRWCPSSAIKCYDHYRSTVETPAHILAYKGARGTLDYMFFQWPDHDLRWYDSIQQGTVVIAVAGLAGEKKENALLDWLDWEDYASLSQVAAKIVVDTQPRDTAVDPNTIVNSIIETPFSGLHPAILPTPTGKVTFGMPFTWDSKLFQELVGIASQSTPRYWSRVIIGSPTRSQQFSGSIVPFQIFPDPETSQIRVYQDAQDAVPGQPWDLILKRDYTEKGNAVKIEHTYANYGMTKSKIRAIKVESRDASGKLLGSRIVTFIVDGIASP